MTTTERSGISRRDILKKGAIAGAVFWSVPVIESVTSAASATSLTGPISCSWAYIVYLQGGNVYAAGYQSTGTNTCTNYAANQTAPASARVSYGAKTYNISLATGTGPPTSGNPSTVKLITYTTTTSPPGLPTPPQNALEPTTCTALVQSGNTVYSASGSGAVILAVFYKNATNVVTVMPSNLSDTCSSAPTCTGGTQPTTCNAVCMFC